MSRYFRQYILFTWSGRIFLLLLLAGIVYALSQAFTIPPSTWIPALILAAFFILGMGFVDTFLAQRTESNIQKKLDNDVGKELVRLQKAKKRAESLQNMTSTLRTSLNFEKVVEASLDVCALAFEEMGIPSRALIGAVMLYDGDELVPLASRGFTMRDLGKTVPANVGGIIHESLKQAEPVATDDPGHDPVLKYYSAFANSFAAVSVPLRAGYQNYGAMVLGSVEKNITFTEEHFDLFNAVADQSVIALENARFYQQLEEEKQRIIQAEEDARKSLSRDLHDGPTQTISAIVMRINFIRSLLMRDPKQAVQELEKVEELAKGAVRDIRGMLFTLRPLVLETQGLGAAIETVGRRLLENDGLTVHLVNGEYGDLLNERAQGVVFYIIDEALGNARKHAQAQNIEVRFWKERDLFVARIKDDGVGFDVSAVNKNYSSRGSLGMVNMHERATLIDGSLRVDSTPGKGTAITLIVPLSKHGRGLDDD
ncbi:MAG: GAF domain-containing sensor histidine kinase [Anaerolineae bacterium]|nr:GAF domain-containing sensor histidine kinase [Anaerolineae bacterium]